MSMSNYYIQNSEALWHRTRLNTLGIKQHETKNLCAGQSQQTSLCQKRSTSDVSSSCCAIVTRTDLPSASLFLCGPFFLRRFSLAPLDWIASRTRHRFCSWSAPFYFKYETNQCEDFSYNEFMRHSVRKPMKKRSKLNCIN